MAKKIKVIQILINGQTFNCPFKDQNNSLIDVATDFNNNFNAHNKYKFTLTDGSMLFLNQWALQRAVYRFVEIKLLLIN